jgi:predicted nucleotidyltransferase
MNPALHRSLQALREHETELRTLGVRHAAIFGSVARGEAHADSDVDILVDLDKELPMGLFEYSRLKLHIAELLGNSADVVNRKTLKPLMKDSILHDAVDAF